MQVIRKIERPIPGERVLEVVPPMLPYTAQAAAPRMRGQFFSGRALTHLALTAEQRARMSGLALLAEAVAPGVIHGLEVGFERGEGAGDDAIVLLPGRALAPSGEDIELGYTVRTGVEDIPIEPTGLRLAATGDDALRNLISGGTDITLGLLRERGALDRVPHAMVLTAVPVTVLIDTTGRLDTPCPNATGEGAFSEIAWEDGFQLRWVPWPADHSLPIWSPDGTKVEPKFRNRLAYAVFINERDRSSLTDRVRALGQERLAEKDPQRQREIDGQIQGLRGRARAWPWEQLGAALAVVGFDAGMRVHFADRGAVVRQGGGRRNRSALVPLAGDDVLWQARVAQLVEHLAEHCAGLPAEELQKKELARLFDWLPPAGILPKDMIDVAAGRQFIFPPNFDVQAQPVPLDMVDALIAESAPLAPFNLSLRDQVQILVPVPARFFERDLLRLDERIHPLFDSEVGRLEGARLDLLVRRDGLRRRFDVLSKAVTGAWPSYPEDDPNALADEAGAADAMAFTRVHLASISGTATVSHGFSGASAPFFLDATDTLFAFVRWEARPARVQLTLHAVGASAPVTVVWGAAPATAEGTAFAGELPAGNDVWQRLTVPAGDLGLGGGSLHGAEFSVTGAGASGRFAWGHLGKLANGLESYWVTDALPPGAAMLDSSAWQWAEQDASIDDNDGALGVPIEGFVRRVNEVENLVASYTGEAGYHRGILAVELGAAPADPNAPRNPHPLDAGLDELIRRLEGRIAAASDHIEFGFLRARTDIFRVRQSVLGVEQAGRLLTSPVAAELIKRSDSPVATEREFADYFARAQEKIVPSAPRSVPGTRGAPRSARAVKRGASTRSVTERAVGFGGTMTSTSFATRPTATFAVTSSTPTAAPEVKTAATAPLLVEKQESTPAMMAIKGEAAAPVAVRPVEPTVKDVVGSSLISASLDNITVGERLSSAPAVVAHNATTKAKTDFVVEGAGILKASGLAIDDLQVSGFADSTGDIKTLGDLAKKNADGIEILDKDQFAAAEEDRHEAEYFKHSLNAMDNMVRFLRQVEIRVEDYRRLQADARAARERILATLTRLEAEISALATRLAEFRHDLAVARALRAEEEQRVTALVQRRKDILAGQVPYLVFRRPQLAKTLVDVPVRNVEPALIEDIVPRCRTEAASAPPELQQMVDTLKEVPARWFAKVHPLVLKFDRIDKLAGLVAQTRERLDKNQVPAVQLGFGAESKTGAALNAAFERHAVRMQKTLVDSRALGRDAKPETWKQAAEMARKVVAVGDLIRAPQADREITLAAAGLLDDIAGVAGCLYSHFSNVPPATRLRWAEQFSQLDAAPNLRSLNVLPGFGDESLGIDYIEWRQMQSLVDWLFQQIEAEDDAVAAINDLVRVALLLASHAPVKRIISARIRQPVPAVIDARIDLMLDPSIARVGMQVLVHAPATQAVVARAVIEDISAGGAVARVAQVLAPAITLDATMKVQLQSGPPLSVPAAAEREAKTAVATPAQKAAEARREVQTGLAAERQAQRGGGALNKLLGKR